MNQTNYDNLFVCQLPKLKLSCWGCCGRNFTNKQEIEQDIKQNTQQFNQIKLPSTLRFLQFRDRLSENPDELMPSGICSNLVKFNGTLACPLHPKINKIVSKKQCLRLNQKDLRVNHCDIACTCDSSNYFQIFNKKEKKEYINWLSKQNLNHYTYSIGNVEGTLIKKFMQEKNKLI